MNRQYTYKFRIYPTKEQEILLSKHFGSIRYVYNLFLDKRTKFYLNAKEKQLAKKSLNYNEMSAELTKLKSNTETEWLNECNSQSLQHSLKHLETAFNRFFKKKSKYPRFKNRRSKQSFRLPQFVSVEDGRIYFPKFKEGIKIDQHRKIEGSIENATISRNVAGQYFACIGVTKNIEIKSELNNAVGIDLGIKSLVVCSDGIRFKNIKPLKQLEKLVRIRQKSVSRTGKKSIGRIKARLKLGKLHVKIANIRSNHLHQISHKLVSENQTLILEDLSAKNMMVDHRYAKSIGDCSWSELVRQICYKSEWYGRKVIKIDRYFPSSKTCSNCGYIKDDLTLKDREWNCPKCNYEHDRDFNASLNILRQGLNLTVGTTGLAVCPDVRPIGNNGRLVGTETHSL